MLASSKDEDFDQKIETTETRYGKMAYYRDDEWVGHCLEQYGEYSEAEADLWRKLIKPGDTVVDVGANIGALTRPLMDIVGPEGKVIAYEAQPMNFALLTANCQDANCIIMQYAVGDKPGSIKVPALSSLPHKNYGGVELRGGTEEDAEVPVVTLDNEFASAINVSFIKIDVEGMEIAVLKGAKGLIERCRPLLYVEDDREENSQELHELLHSYDYVLYRHTPLLFSDQNFKDAPIVDSPTASFNLLCIPKEDTENREEILRNLRLVIPQTNTRKVKANTGWACIARLGGIGDNLIAASVLRPLKRMGYKIEVISQNPQACVFENNPFVDKLTIKDSRRELPQNDQMAWQKYWWARALEYQRFTNLSHSVEVLGAQFPASTAFWWPAKMRRRMCGQSYLEAAHDVADVPYEFGPLFFPTDEEVEDILKVRKRLGQRPLIAWCVSGTRVDKLYTYSSHVIARILAELDADVIMLSAPAPRPDVVRAEQIQEHVRITNSKLRGLYEARTVNLEQPEWPIRRMLTLAMKCDLVVGPDTGPMWAVAMEQVPKILLHSHASVENITKHWVNTISLSPSSTVKCWPCHLLHDGPETCQEEQMRSGLKPSPEDKGAACINSITVEAVLNAVRQQLGR